MALHHRRQAAPPTISKSRRSGVWSTRISDDATTNGEGIQHIAFLSSDIEKTIAAVETAGIEFLDAPSAAYYQSLDTRVPGHGQDLDSIQRRGILVDGKGEGRILLQRLTRRLGPVFFEMIERRGEDGFGEGNFKALFESQEQDQARRGSLGVK